MKKEIMSKTSRLVHTAGLKIKKYSPEILLGAGIVGTVTSTVMACKATPKAVELLKEAKETVNNVHIAAENKPEVYTEQDVNKAVTIAYAQTGVKLAKLYAPAIAVGTLSIASILYGHKILKKRNVALAAAYAVVDKGFKNYRKNVVDRFGEAIDKELRYNIKAKEIEVETINENGETVVTKEIINEAQLDPSDYARFFDETSCYYKKDAEYNLMFLKQQQNWANEKLKAQGYLFLNDVYKMLGFQQTRAGQSVGWVYDENNEVGDNYIDFNIYNGSERSRAFINGYERAILLDFNVDGNIMHIFPRK